MECGPSVQWNIIQSSKEGCLTAAAAWMDLEDMTLTEISQSQQGKYWMIPLTSATENSQTPDKGSRMAVARAAGWGEWGVAV